MEKTSEKKGMLEQLPPKKAFWAGFFVATGIWVVLSFMVSIIVLLVVLISGADFGKSKTTKTTGTTTGTTAAADAGTAAPSGTIDPDSLEHVRGEGAITVVEYSDIDCPFCQRFHGTMQQVMEEYEGEVAWAYKHFPLTSLHPNAQAKAVASECVAEQDADAFWSYLDALFENPSTATDEITTEAEALGINIDELNDCIDADTYGNKVASESSEAQSFGGQGTPYSLIIDEDGEILDAIPGALPYEQVKQLLDQYTS